MRNLRLLTSLAALTAAFSATLTATPAFALSNYSPSNLSTLTQGNVDDLIRSVGVLGSYRAYQSAAPLEMVIGLDVGVDFTIMNVPDELKSALAATGAVSGAGDAPSLLPLPRFNVHKGLPWGLDVGFSYFGDGDQNSVWGVDLRYALVAGGIVSPSLGLRASYSQADLLFMDTTVFGFDAVLSKTFALIFDPYVGVGLQFISGNLNAPAGTPPLPGGVSMSSSTVATHLYFGLPIKLVFLKLTPEYDINFSGIKTYGLKASIAL